MPMHEDLNKEKCHSLKMSCRSGKGRDWADDAARQTRLQPKSQPWISPNRDNALIVSRNLMGFLWNNEDCQFSSVSFSLCEMPCARKLQLLAARRHRGKMFVLLAYSGVYCCGGLLSQPTSQ